MTATAVLDALDYYLPVQVLDNRRLAAEFPEWSVEKIEEKTGIRARHIASENETSADLAVAAAEKLFASGRARREEVDFLLFCTQSPDYFLPTTACLIQQRLGLARSTGALDFNLGCSGWVYGLSLAKALVESGQARVVLLLTGETYSKFIHPRDKSVRTLFGDGGSATVVRRQEEGTRGIGPFVFGTDGRGGENLIVPTGGFRHRPSAADTEELTDESGNVRSRGSLFMNGPEIFAFTLRVVPKAVRELLAKAELEMAQIDHFVFHQANRYMLEHLRSKLGIREDRFVYALLDVGNTVSATIPLALREAEGEGRLQSGDLVMVVGFGVGYSWSAGLLRW